MRTLLVLALGLLCITGYVGVTNRRTAPVTVPTVAPVAVPAVPMTHDFAVPVLMYHRVCELTPREARSPLMRDLTVPPVDFAWQMQYLRDNEFTIISVEDVERALRERLPLPVKAVAVTMDDGYRDNFTCAYPILRRHQAPATVFLVTSVVGDAAHLTWEHARNMRQGDCGFQSHTVHHYDLTTLNDEQLHSELIDSRETITVHLRRPVSQVAYPSGAFNDRVVAGVRAAGYTAAWKKGGGPVTPDCDPLRLPRIRVHGRTTPDDFARKVWSGVYTREQRASQLIH
ncbi:MAG: Poly-beta-1,6-N-acetyl-D-glucosamine N-deacetylase precursor [bacterium ADurb.Bin429]|nr:MAG: Poly-beta-1,6-N-acetyl-D-glucosamine N-deacetylase precursor [bacterium ADurb.Bin429]